VQGGSPFGGGEALRRVGKNLNSSRKAENILFKKEIQK